IRRRRHGYELPLNPFRDQTIPTPEQVFSCSENRAVLERAFLSVGAQLVRPAQQPNPAICPMGFNQPYSLGFGAICLTHCNISNNCPLALWYGDPGRSEDHVLSRWYPLFSRKGWVDAECKCS